MDLLLAVIHIYMIIDCDDIEILTLPYIKKVDASNVAHVGSFQL